MSINWDIEKEGEKAWKEANGDTTKINNPYPEKSWEWKSWNFGWNMAGMETITYEDKSYG